MQRPVLALLDGCAQSPRCRRHHSFHYAVHHSQNWPHGLELVVKSRPSEATPALAAISVGAWFSTAVAVWALRLVGIHIAQVRILLSDTFAIILNGVVVEFVDHGHEELALR